MHSKFQKLFHNNQHHNNDIFLFLPAFTVSYISINRKYSKSEYFYKIKAAYLHICFPYVVGQEADCYADDENGPEDMETLQNHKQAVEKVVAEERRVDGHWVNPGPVNDPETHREDQGGGNEAQRKTTFS